MSFLLSIDPGVRGCGAALFMDRELRRAAYVLNPIGSGDGPAVAVGLARAVVEWMGIDASQIRHLAMEFPQVYGGRAAKGDANDLFTLAALDGALAALCPRSTVKHYLPQSWKGSIQKPVDTKGKDYMPYIITEMVERRLEPAEAVSIKLPETKKPDGSQHKSNTKLTWDVFDAIGVGLKYLGRFEKMRSYARD